MIKTLYVNGCSWTEGHLLEEQQETRDYAKQQGYDFVSKFEIKKDGEFVVYPFVNFYNKFNWAGNIAQALNIPTIVNEAVGAASNDRIVRTTIDYVRNMSDEEKKTTFIIIGWSIPDRGEIYLDDKHGVEHWCRFHASHPFRETLTWPHLNTEFVERIDKFHQQYIVDVHTDYSRIHYFFQQSYLLANLLEHHSIKYYFFNSFPVDWRAWAHDSTISKFAKELKDYRKLSVLDVHDNFFNYIEHDSSCQLSDGHPNIKGYQVWADHILKDMKRKGIV